MSGEKIVFKIVPGETLSKGWNDEIRWPNFFSVKKAKLVQLGKEDETIELPVRICGNKVGKRGFLCITDEEENTLKTISSNDKTGYSEYTENDVGFLYQSDILFRVLMDSEWKEKPYGAGRLFSYAQPSVSKYQYVTQEELNDTYKYYFSDEKGKMIRTNDNRSLQYIGLNISEGKIKDALSKIPENIILSKAFAKVFVEKLTEGQLKTLANNLNNEKLQILVKNLTDKQLQVLAEHLTDGQFQALVDHLTNHQLQTLAKELNPEKLQIIVSLLDQDQFKALIKTLNDEQFTVLVKDLAEHHLTILSKELEGDQLKELVNSLREDQLKDLVNKLDTEKLETIAQDLTDPNRVQMIIESLSDKPEKLQAFAREMPDQQFTKLLDQLNAEAIKNIIHNLPYEKVKAVIGDKDQSRVILDTFKANIEKQNEHNKKMIKMLEDIQEDMPYSAYDLILTAEDGDIYPYDSSILA